MAIIGFMLTLLVGPYFVLQPFGVDELLRGRIGIALVFAFTALGHFVKTTQMSQMLPPQVPGRVPLIYVTGVLELLFAIGVLVPSLTYVVGVALCAFLVAITPSNIFAAIKRVPFGGHEAGPIYLLIRLPLQAFLIAWVYWFAVRPH